MRRRSGRRGDHDINLDSLLDILSNVVGVMVLLAVMTVLSSQSIQISLGTPLLRDPPSAAKRVLFEVRDQQLYFVDEPAIQRSEADVFSQLRQTTGAEPTGLHRMAAYQEHDIGDASYRVQLKCRNVGGTTRDSYYYEPRDGVPGESIRQLNHGESNFERRLAQTDPDREFIQFIVRVDSFEAYEAARRVAEKYDLSTGWTPWGVDEPLRFESGGQLGSQIQ